MAEVPNSKKQYLSANAASDSTTSYLFSLSFTFILCLVSLVLFGTYYGWLDDVYALNLIKGTFSVHGFPPTDQFMLISRVWMLLYKYIPSVPWYGLSMLVFTILGTANILYCLLHAMKSFSYKRWIVYVLFSMLFFLFFAENFLLLNFTRTAILLAGSSLLCLVFIDYKSESRRRKILFYVWFSLHFVIGYLIRYDVVFFPIVFVLSCAFIKVLFDKKRLFNFLFPAFGIVILVVMHLSAYHIFKTEDLLIHYKKRPYVFNILDANNIRNYDKLTGNPRDSIRMFATLGWYYYDDEQIDIPFLERLGGKENLFNTVHHWKQNIQEEYGKIKDRRETYQKGLPLNVKFHMLNVFNLLLLITVLLLSFSSKDGKKLGFMTFLFNLAFYILFFFSTVLFKYEDRTYAPMAVLLFTVNLTMLLIILRSYPLSMARRSINVLCLILLPLMALRMKVLHDISMEKKQEMALKSKFIEELNTKYTGKIFLYDMWTLGLVHGTPLKDIVLNKHNIHTIYGDSFYQDITEHRDYIKDRISPFVQFVDFYDGIRNREDVIFVLVDFRANLMENYFRILYGRDYQFVPIQNAEINNIKNSFVWETLHYGMYNLK